MTLTWEAMQEMIADADRAAQFTSGFQNTLTSDVACHVKALVAEVEELQIGDAKSRQALERLLVGDDEEVADCPQCGLGTEMPKWIERYHTFDCECGCRFEAEKKVVIVSRMRECRE